MAGVIGGPLSGWILATFDGTSGMAGWKWLYLIEAIPSVVLGLLVLAYLDDKIGAAKWLDDEQKRLLQRNIAADLGQVESHSVRAAFGNAKVWILCAAYFGLIMGLYGIGFWLPTLIKASGVTSPASIGWLVVVPYAAAVAAMLWTSRSSDERRERRWHIAIPAIAGAIGLVVSTLVPQTTPWAIVTLTIATMGILTGLAQFWCLPPAFLGGMAAAAGIALINSVGNLAGFASPFIVGFIKDSTGSTNAGLFVIAASLVLAAAIVLGLSKRVVDR
jgi:nitrate/nitrite transporter NarK